MGHKDRCTLAPLVSARRRHTIAGRSIITANVYVNRPANVTLPILAAIHQSTERVAVRVDDPLHVRHLERDGIVVDATASGVFDVLVSDAMDLPMDRVVVRVVPMDGFIGRVRLAIDIDVLVMDTALSPRVAYTSVLT